MGVATPPPPSPPRRRRSRRNLPLSHDNIGHFSGKGPTRMTQQRRLMAAPWWDCYTTTLLSWHQRSYSAATKKNPNKKIKSSCRPSTLPRSLHFIHLHYKLVYYFALLARAARNESWHNETSPRGCGVLHPSPRVLRGATTFDVDNMIRPTKKKWQKKTSWNKDLLHFRQPAAAFLRLFLSTTHHRI